MPLSSESVGQSGETLEQDIDARWTMAYAAGLGLTDPEFMDTTARPDVLAHPLFPVCFEWPLMISDRHTPRALGLEAHEALRGVHATHELRLHRPIRAEQRVRTRATVVAVEARKPGAYQLTRLDTESADGRPLCSTWYGTLYRGVEVSGGDRRIEDPGAPDRAEADAAEPEAADWNSVEVPIAAEAAHVYTECARIWNPIHTDAAVAQRAGLPAIILHGTATLALGVSGVVRELLDGQFERVARVTGRFGAMVPLPSTCRLRMARLGPYGCRFEMLNDEGQTALREGRVELREPS